MNDLLDSNSGVESSSKPTSMMDLIEGNEPKVPEKVYNVISKKPESTDLGFSDAYNMTMPLGYQFKDKEEQPIAKSTYTKDQYGNSIPELSTDTKGPSIISNAIDKVSKFFGGKPNESMQSAVSAQAVVSLLAKEKGIPLSAYRTSPEFLEQAGNAFFSTASFGLTDVFRKSMTSEVTNPATNLPGYIGYGLGSLAGLMTMPMTAATKIVSPVIKYLPKATQEAPIIYRMLTESLRDAAVLGPAMGLVNTGKALESTTFGEASDNIWKGVKSGALTGAIFGVTKGMFPGDSMGQMLARVSTGLVGLNAQRAIEKGGNPFVDRPVGEVVFDALLDAMFLYRGMPKGEFIKLAGDLESVVQKKVDIEQKKSSIDGLLDEDLKRAQEKVLEIENIQANLQAEEIAKKAASVTLIKEKLRKQGDDINEVKQAIIDQEGKFVPESEVEGINERANVYRLYAEAKRSGKIEDDIKAEQAMVEFSEKYPELVKEENKLDVMKRGRSMLDIIEPKEEVVNEKVQAETKTESELAEFKGMTKGPNGEDLYWYDKPLEDGTMTTGVTKDPRSVEWKNKSEVDAVSKKVEPITDLDLQTGTPVPDKLSTEKSPFRESPERTQELKSMFEERKKAVSSDVELGTSKLINDVNRWLDGDDSVDIKSVRNDLSELATRADELRDNFDRNEFHKTWKNTVSEAAAWARNADRKINLQSIYRQGNESGKWWTPDKQYVETFGKVGKKIHKRKLSNDINLIDEEVLRSKMTEEELNMKDMKGYDRALNRLGYDGMERLEGSMSGEESKSYYISDRKFILQSDSSSSGNKLYSGIPLDEASKLIIEGAKKLSEYTKKARGMKEFRPTVAIKMLKEELNRAFVDRSGNIRRELLDKLGDDGYEIIQKMYLSKGASSLSASMLKQMQKEVYSGFNKNEKRVLDNLILADHILDIGKYKTESEFNYPEGLKPTQAAAYNELFQYIEKLDSKTADTIKQRAAAYYEWMKRPLKDMLEVGLIDQKEHDALASHNYRRLKLVDVFDKRYEVKVGDKKRTVYDSGVQALSRGRDTDVFEPSSEIMALEVFNRAYGRILNNKANQTLLDLARKDKENPFVRVKESKSDTIPTGWNRIFVYEEGQRKAIYLSPEMSKEWITNSPEMSYKMSQILRYASGSPVLRTMATGIDCGFALANLPRDIMHTWFASRTYDPIGFRPVSTSIDYINGKVVPIATNLEQLSKWKSVYSPYMPMFIAQMGKDQASVFSDALLRKGRYEDYIKEGGGMEFLVHQGRLFQRGRHVEGSIDKVMNFLGYLGETSEIMTRLAIRERVIRRRANEQGISFEKASKDKDITTEATFAARDYMDFGQGGGIAKAADNALPYLNASIQGTRGLFRAFKDNPVSSSFKLAQFGALVTGLYIANNALNPESTKALHGNIDMQNNLCIPLGDWSKFEDDKGQTRYMYFKIPLDPGQRFFKTFFEASTDKWLGNDVDTKAVSNSFSQISPVSISSLPPTLAGTLGYVSNKDFWLNEDIWKKTDKPLSWPGSKEEFIPGQTPQAFVDLGKVTGLSPERSKKAVEQLVTGNSMWSWLVGHGYDAMFSDLPKDMKEKHLAHTLAKVPVVKRFIGLTNPYSQFAGAIEDTRDKASLNRWIENRGLDTLVDGYLYKENVNRSDINDYMRSFKDKDTYDRLKDRFEFSEKIKDLPNRSFWLALKGTPDTDARAKLYVERFDKASESEQEQIRHEAAIIKRAGGIISDEFNKAVMKIRMGE